MTLEKTVIEFIKKRNYILVKELGQGACGKTVLLHDDVIDENFVCKKYSPYYAEHRDQFFDNFIREIKLLHKLYHPNVVRIFNYHIYPEKLTGYILMEYIDGTDILEFIKENPLKINDIFAQAISGFKHLESRNILHRDIRPLNILIQSDGVLKIIDLGFGKQIEESSDFDKSISLNLWCPPPNEFIDKTYDFSTEIYFVGKLFELAVHQIPDEYFRYKSIINKMCKADKELRFLSFSDVEQNMLASQISEVEFWGQERSSYKNFATSISFHLHEIENGTKYVEDHFKIIGDLEKVYQDIMLEDTAPDCGLILKCFLVGGFKYRIKDFSVSTLKEFINLMKSSPEHKRSIIMANIKSRMDTIKRYTKYKSGFDFLDDDIPF